MRAPLRAGIAAAALATLALTAAVPVPSVVPDGVPDRGPVLSEPIDRGRLVLAPRSDLTPTTKVVDGDASDWVGAPGRIGGNAVWDAGEHVYSDFLFDAHGADDGGDLQRLTQFAGLLYEEERTWRVDQVLRTSGSQLGVPEPVGAPDEYGDVAGGLDVGDLTEVRLASDGRDLQLLVRVTNLTDRARLGVLVLADGSDGPAGDVGLGSGLTTARFDRAVLLSASGAVARDVAAGTEETVADAATAVDHAGYDNVLEASLPLDLLADDGTLDVGVVTGRLEDDGSFTPLNVAYRHAEPLEIWNDRLQALDLLAGTVDRFSSGTIAVADLVAGRTETLVHPGPGYHEVQLVSDEGISSEGGRDGILQPYGLYVPTAFVPGSDLPITYWLHYRGGKAHSGVVINPRLVTQLGEEPGHLVVFPHGRGTSEWYVTESHQDVLEVMADVERRLPEADELRRYVSGYSMGGYGSWLFASLYPDLFAAAFVQSGAVTQGAWLGGGPDHEPDPFLGQGWVEANGGDARAQLTFRVLENLRHVPVAIDHGTDDELVPITGIERMAARLTELGYEHRLTRFLGYEHFSQAAVDEWADGAAYLSRFAIDPDPREVTYAVVPVLTWALNHVDPPADASFDLRPDGAYWIDSVTARDVPLADPTTGRPVDAAKAVVEAVSHAIAAAPRATVPDAGAVSPPGHSTPYVRSGLRTVEGPAGVLPADAVANRLELTLTNVESVTADARRARLDLRQPVAVSVETDGATTVRLSGRAVTALKLAGGPVDGVTVSRDDGDLVLALAGGGTYEFTLARTR